MNITRSGFRWLGRSAVLVIAFAAGCAEPSSAPTGSWTVPTVSTGGLVDTTYAVTLATDIAMQQNDRPVDFTGCEKLNVGDDKQLAARLFARGVQIYRWDGAAWTFVAPSADLYANEVATGVIATHYAGPTWESASGSKVIGAVAERCPRESSNIPWLLLRATALNDSGVFHHVTDIQRVNTVGGVVPANGGTIVGQEARIPYTAEYLFYRQK
jgi:hypothetical protein